MLEVHMDRERTGLDRFLVRVPAAGYEWMVVSFFYSRYRPVGGYHMWNEITEAEAEDIKKRGWAVAEADLTKTPKTEVFAINGADPEVLAYGMAKYSRSALSLKDSLKEISSQKAEQFLNTFYFQYGHRSIADLAHIPLGLENISLLAAIEVVDEQRWDGQERSTRYQDFSKRLYYTPSDLNEVEAALYHKSIHALFTAYDDVFEAASADFKEKNPRPEGMEEAAYERTLRARTFDVARYLLPLATLTSVGQITSARTLEAQIARLLDSEYPEVRELATKMKKATTGPSYNAKDEKVREAFRHFYEVCPNWSQPEGATDALTEIYNQTGLSPALAPTLVKYAERSPYGQDLADFVAKHLEKLHIPVLCQDGRDIEHEQLMDCIISTHPSAEIVSTIIYEHTNRPFRAIWKAVHGKGTEWIDNFLKGALALRGKFDELPRCFRAGSGVIFDIHMDIGGFRDMHRHRRAQQHIQAYTADDFQLPEPLAPAVEKAYLAAVKEAQRACVVMNNMRETYGRPLDVTAYMLPLGTKVRFLMKMDVAEIAYIAELRTGPAGHISYRRVAWQMFQALKDIAPALAEGIADRVTDPDSPLDFFKR